ncbi:ABC transporter permease [Anaeromicrobium sediminis]|uniref:Transport permease protein n=1 Tax=Anaeromicrobium sediminis TaxID=1478221 RepID=A0A267MHI6_9FIRM|nr:ABC transporter permease [Anaeromicrobium sediminis]PAB59041.1 multidrug ABC transporter permease [Anaeromicrobium sediminis]
MEICTILWREWIFFKRQLGKITGGAIMNPLLYLIAFGWGFGEDIVVEGYNYMYYLIPGIIALSTMNTSFNAISLRVIVSKIYEKSFEYYLTAPVNIYLLALGHVLAGALRGMYAAFLIIIISYIFGIYIKINLALIFIIFLNSMLFSAFGYYAAILIKSHYQINWFKTYINTPMTFLCGTFFSLEKMPNIVKAIIEILPLTHASRSLRAIALNGQISITSIGVLFMYLIVFYFLSVYASFQEVE